MAGTCLDNAVVERFFSSLKQESVYWSTFKTKSEAKDKIVDYIEKFYNPKRQHSVNHGLSPMEKEHRFRCNTLIINAIFYMFVLGKVNSYMSLFIGQSHMKYPYLHVL